jgi:hypothetical protein
MRGGLRIGRGLGGGRKFEAHDSIDISAEQELAYAPSRKSSYGGRLLALPPHSGSHAAKKTHQPDNGAHSPRTLQLQKPE